VVARGLLTPTAIQLLLLRSACCCLLLDSLGVPTRLCFWFVRGSNVVTQRSCMWACVCVCVCVCGFAGWIDRRVLSRLAELLPVGLVCKSVHVMSCHHPSRRRGSGRAAGAKCPQAPTPVQSAAAGCQGATSVERGRGRPESGPARAAMDGTYAPPGPAAQRGGRMNDRTKTNDDAISSIGRRGALVTRYGGRGLAWDRSLCLGCMVV